MAIKFAMSTPLQSFTCCREIIHLPFIRIWRIGSHLHVAERLFTYLSSGYGESGVIYMLQRDYSLTFHQDMANRESFTCCREIIHLPFIRIWRIGQFVFPTGDVTCYCVCTFMLKQALATVRSSSSQHKHNQSALPLVVPNARFLTIFPICLCFSPTLTLKSISPEIIRLS